MFAILAAGGDTGAAVGPWLLGLVADLTPIGSTLSPLRTGMLVGTLFPVAMVVTLIVQKRLEKRVPPVNSLSQAPSDG
jgi:uncharacterized membrane-anchored protein